MPNAARTARKPGPAGFRLGIVDMLAYVVAVVLSAFSPRPAASLIRALFDRDAKATVDEMAPYVPSGGVEVRRDVAYGDSGRRTSFDWFSPEGARGPLPTIVWIHGGAWISGRKENVDPYVHILAARGFTGVSLDYTISPGADYPDALRELNAALGFLLRHADEYRIDPERIVLAGDSAGAQYVSQLALLISNPVYAAELGIRPSLTRTQLRGVVLNCGIYDLRGIPAVKGLGGWGFRIALWSYLGRRDWSGSTGAQQMSTITHVTADFPPAWISGGNADPLTKGQSEPMAEKLRSLGVHVTSVFYPDDEDPPLNHEYQFHLDHEASRRALESTAGFVRRVTR